MSIAELKPVSRSLPTRRQKAVAWSVHLLTASGVVVALLMLIAAGQQAWREVFWLMALSIIVDGFDGTLARKAEVKAILPGFDGALLDNIIDYLTYAFLPAYLITATGLIPGPVGVLAAILIVLTAAYQFCQADAKTEDHYFKGFPSYWNIAVYYMFLLQWPAWFNAALLVGLGILVFVPVKYIYPSRTTRFRYLTYAMTGLWAATQVVILLRFDATPAWLIYSSMLYVFYYVAISLWLTVRSRG